METISVPGQRIIAPHKQGYLSHSDEDRPVETPAQQYRNLRRDLVTFNTSEERKAASEAKKSPQARLTTKTKQLK